MTYCKLVLQMRLWNHEFEVFSLRYFGFGQYKEEDLEIVINRSDVIEAEIEEWVEDAEDAFDRLLAHLTKLEGMPQGDYHMFGSKRSLEKIYAT